ncbi:hypothetical protein [Paenibacillus taihuensis]|uniref:hypothetical protein n=1 Tax=Paenibacillus taihuensis TaxID=1156355 RepID=UPI000E27E37D|nr:hypothetical protein [Paenibacillus taihuensis]
MPVGKRTDPGQISSHTLVGIELGNIAPSINGRPLPYANPDNGITLGTVTVRLTNSGNHAAAVTLYVLIPYETSLDGLVIYVNGREVHVIPGEGVFIGILDPGATVVITYRLQLSDPPFQSRIRFRIRAAITYEVNGVQISNTVYSNEVVILIETHDE